MQSNAISKAKFKARALELFRQVESSGEPLIVTNHGKPVLEVRRYRAQEPDPLQLLRGSVLRYSKPTEPIGDDDWDASK